MSIRHFFAPFVTGFELGLSANSFGKPMGSFANLWLEFIADVPWLIEGTGFAVAALVHGRDMPPPGKE